MLSIQFGWYSKFHRSVIDHLTHKCGVISSQCFGGRRKIALGKILGIVRLQCFCEQYSHGLNVLSVLPVLAKVPVRDPL